MKKLILIINLLLSISIFVIAQNGTIKGKLTDASSGEELIGSTIVIQGTSVGVVSDFEGNYIFNGVKPGVYNLVVNYLSYNQQIVPVTVKAGETTQQNILLSQVTIGLDEVVIKRVRRTNTDISMLNMIKTSDLIVTGISAEQIAKTQDKDAAEIIRRVPGITITDGKFVIVRGLSERYNSVLLNGATAPSFDANTKAFAMDAIPSNMIDNILIYKSPAPELPADFSGAVINISTKQNADENEIKISYKTTYKQNVSFNNNYQTYEGGKYDWLGFDDGTREIPSTVPNTNEFQEYYVWKDQADYKKKMTTVSNLSKDFNNTWTSSENAPYLDQSISFSVQKRFTAGKVSFGNITATNYKYENSYIQGTRSEYYSDEATNENNGYSFNYQDTRSIKSVSLGLIHNWMMVFGNNQKIEFRNFFNNLGESSSNLRVGDYIYNSETSNLINLRYKQRSIYSGQLAGKHGLSNNLTVIDWLAGYSRTNNDEPDNRIIKYSREIETTNPYEFKVDKEVNVFNGGRVTNNLWENVYSGMLNINQKIFLFNSNNPFVIKAGMSYENKHRQYYNRQLGIVAPRGTQNLDVNLEQLPEDLLVEENFFVDTTTLTRTGFTYKDGTFRKNSYQAINQITAGYLGVKIPITKFIEIYGGARIEKLYRKIYDFYENTERADSLDLVTDTLNIFPSVNITFKINEKHQIKTSFGKTINHPEFREIAPTDYYDFDLNAIVHGNPNLKDAYINNFDIRYEWYPNTGEMLSVAAFYKYFTNPIEASLVPAGTTYDYIPFNTEIAASKGIEVDIRKGLHELEGTKVNFLKDLTVIFNGSIIRSEITTDTLTNTYARDVHRIMMGQSPFIVNFGLYYDNPKSGTKVNVSYNKIGSRISKTGSPSTPHTFELPRNLLDLNVSQKIGKRTEIGFSVKDLINNKVQHVQYFGKNEDLPSPATLYTPNRSFSIEVTVRL